MRLIMLSPPGAGKGTHCAWLTEETGVAHISSGDLLRAEIARGTDLGHRLAGYTGRGALVPDDVMFDLLVPVVVAAVRDTGGYLLDGFPRTLPQALRAQQIGRERSLAADAVVYLTAPEPVLVSRLLARAAEQGRADDTPEVVAHRLAVYADATAPLIDHYRERGLLMEVDADRPVAEIRDDLRGRLVERGLLGSGAGPAAG
jgi:adenylate kinase